MSSPAGIEPNVARREAALRFLYDRIDYERVASIPYRSRQFKLDRTRQLLARLGNPEQALPVIHVAGTKGKGSTAAMIGAVLSAAGYRTGVFTSPHLDRLEERVAIDGRPCSSEELVELVDRLAPVVQAMDKEAAAIPSVGHLGCPTEWSGGESGPTYFEIITAVALLHFARRNVKAAILEVGLGGRLDSTNVCRPRVSVITSISYDHTKQLGNSLESIAREKAGIIKPAVPVISGVVDCGPRQVIRKVCRQRGCRLVELGVDFDFRYRPPRGLESKPEMGRIDFYYNNPACGDANEDVPLKLLGRHQAANAAVALATLAELGRAGWRIPERSVRTGLAQVVCPARVELVARRPAIVVDTAHNPASIDALIRVLEESFSARRRLLIFATTREKDIPGMLSRLAGRFDRVIFTRYLNNPRAVPPEQLEAMARGLSGCRSQVCPDAASAWKEVLQLATPEDLICVTGSFFIAAEIRSQIRTCPFPKSLPTSPADPSQV